MSSRTTRGGGTAAAPQVLTLTARAKACYTSPVGAAKVGSVGTGDFGAFVLTLDEVAPPPVETALTLRARALPP